MKRVLLILTTLAIAVLILGAAYTVYSVAGQFTFREGFYTLGGQKLEAQNVQEMLSEVVPDEARVVVLTYFSAKCQHCLEQLPELNSVNPQNGRVFVLARSVGDSRASVKKLVKEFGLNFMIVTGAAQPPSEGVPDIYIMYRAGDNWEVVTHHLGAVAASSIDEQAAIALIVEEPPASIRSLSGTFWNGALVISGWYVFSPVDSPHRHHVVTAELRSSTGQLVTNTMVTHMVKTLLDAAALEFGDDLILHVHFYSEMYGTDFIGLSLYADYGRAFGFRAIDYPALPHHAEIAEAVEKQAVQAQKDHLLFVSQPDYYYFSNTHTPPYWKSEPKYALNYAYRAARILEKYLGSELGDEMWELVVILSKAG